MRRFPADFLLEDPEALQRYGSDWTKVYAPAPCAVALPRTTQEVSDLVALCHAHRQAIVPSGGRTGLAGGAVAMRGEVVVSLERMNRMEKVDALGRTLRVQAGAVTEAVHQHSASEGLTWPIDVASKGSSQVGGNIATHAGGVHVIRYGSVRQWVLGLEVVLADGTILTLQGALEKDNTGLDLRHLFIGSEGILGIVTQATLKLTPLPTQRTVMVFGLARLDHVVALFQAARRGPLTLMAYEFFTQACLTRLQNHRRLRSPFQSPAAYYVLLEIETALSPAWQTWVASVFEHQLVQDGVVASTQSQAAELWALREGISESLSATGYPHKNDVAVPIAQLESFCAALEGFFACHYPGLDICIFGHVGDGNIHVNVMKPDALSMEAFLQLTQQADHAIFSLVRSHQGSISAEHGIGLLKKAYVSYCKSPAEWALLKAVKRTLDPRGMLNPGKVVDVDTSSCASDCASEPSPPCPR